MKYPKRKSLVLLASTLLTLAGAFAASHRSKLELPVSETSSTNHTANETKPIPSQTPESITPQAVGPIDRQVIGGGGGTSTGGSIKVEGTVGEVSASGAMTGGSITMAGGFWNTLDAAPTSTVQFSSVNSNVQEDCTSLTITVIRSGQTSAAASVDYSTSNGTATERGDYITALGKLQFAAGATSQSLVVLINEDSFVEGPETFNVNLTGPSGVGLGGPSIATITITDDASEPGTNVIDDSRNYVCQHYHDFLNRQPDSGGWDFWTNQIIACGSDQACIEARRINVSASFFLSIEFQQTGYLVERSYKTAYGDATSSSTFGGAHQLPVPTVRFFEFLTDTQQITKGVIVLQPGWEQLLEANKQSFLAEFVQRARFTIALPTTMTPAEFVDKLNQNAGNVLSPDERATAIDLFGGAGNTTNTTARAQAVRQVAEDQDLQTSEFNRAFVLMEYLGYLRRNPDDPQDTDHTGYDFWLTKLNQFGGNYISAEMVKAFITSIEYRQRFGP